MHEIDKINKSGIITNRNFFALRADWKCTMAKSQEDIDRETNQERHDAAEQRGAAGLDHVAPYMNAVGLDERQQEANDAAQAGHDNGVKQSK